MDVKEDIGRFFVINVCPQDMARHDASFPNSDF
jgi:hypothetical protein